MAIAAASRSLRTGLLAARAAFRPLADAYRVPGCRAACASAFAARRDAAANGGIRGYASLPSLPFRGFGAPSCYYPDEEQLSFHAYEYRDGFMDHAEYLFHGDAHVGDRPWCGPIGDDGLPTWLDWRLRGAVGPVKNQLVHGPCWAYAAVEALGIEFFLASGGKLVRLSEQHILDGNNVSNEGFERGCVPEAYHYIYKEQYGISFAKDYPYIGKPCRMKQDEEAVLVPMTGYGTMSEEYYLKKALSKTAVTCAIEVSSDWTDYSGGILTGPGSGLRACNHCVTAVAYGVSRDKRGFFVVKDSFGKFGPYGGHVYLARGLYPEGGTLGLARFCCFPRKIISKKVPETWVKPIRSQKALGIKKKPFQQIHYFLGQMVMD